MPDPTTGDVQAVAASESFSAIHFTSAEAFDNLLMVVDGTRRLLELSSDDYYRCASRALKKAADIARSTTQPDA